MVKIKCCDLRTQSFKEICKQLEDLKLELLNLRVAKVTGGGASKLSKIRVIRKAIARTYIVYNQKRKEVLRMLYKNDGFKPLDLRKKQFRAKRKSLNEKQKSRKSLKGLRKISAYPQRSYAVRE